RSGNYRIQQDNTNTKKIYNSFNSSNFSSLIGQGITESTRYLTPENINSFNNSNFGSLIGQPITESARYLTPETIASWNNSDFNPVIGQAITETTKYLISDEGNNISTNPELWLQFQNYEKILGSINVNSNQDENNLDFVKLLEGMQKQIDSV
ncbi:hypothetical protein, partial [Nostoc sp. 'Peltigera malacea cyanobiont' DB3992]|uniref:hypothetical protein n=1 Tax=Nostoc sp. 'Peltigera malacea cyanobiont' DB3992 TaxID=1206980 RepID=UPI000C067B5F